MTSLPSESVRAVRQHLADVIDRAVMDDTPTVVTRRGKEVAAVVPIEILRRYSAWQEAAWNQLIDQRMANPAAGVPLEDALRETLDRDE
jgi:prevent-host-death family protein